MTKSINSAGNVEFATGAVRSTDREKVRYDLITPIGLRRVAETYHEGSEKYNDFNWEKGMPINDLLNHAIPHIYAYLSGDRSEDHLAHAAWNLLAALHSEEQWPHLNGNLRGVNGNPTCLTLSLPEEARQIIQEATETPTAQICPAATLTTAGENLNSGEAVYYDETVTMDEATPLSEEEAKTIRTIKPTKVLSSPRLKTKDFLQPPTKIKELGGTAVERVVESLTGISEDAMASFTNYDASRPQSISTGWYSLIGVSQARASFKGEVRWVSDDGVVWDGTSRDNLRRISSLVAPIFLGVHFEYLGTSYDKPVATFNNSDSNN